MNFILVVLRNVISALAGIIMTVLALRFVLALFGITTAGPLTGIVTGIYNFSSYLVAPIAATLPVPTYVFDGKHAFESVTLIAMLLYGLLASVLLYLLRLGKRS